MLNDEDIAQCECKITHIHYEAYRETRVQKNNLIL